MDAATDSQMDRIESFWRFALALYAKPGVAPACLELQDRHGKDVIIALYSCWAGASGRGALDRAAIDAADACARPWRQQVVEPLRRTRHALKGIAGAETLYARMKEIELEAERAAIARLAPLAPISDHTRPAADRVTAARENLTLYLGPDAAHVAEPILAAIEPA
ncbi:MAG TPA: TIGR02444 family protein [Stellaceae bacterium]|nr:TIGR02444 family protein [Stellaceae bacterium]